jgi:cytochrome c peroxidase
MLSRPYLLSAGAILGVLIVAGIYVAWPRAEWTEDEIHRMRGLWIGNLSAVLPDPSNAVADDPLAAELGRQLFFDTRLSSNGQVSCATCHQPERVFSDGQPFGRGVGTTGRKTPTLVGAAFSPWQFWDGRSDSLWSQALGPLESAVEHGGTRSQYAHLIAEHYRTEYEAIFGPLPDLSDPERFPSVAGPLADSEARAAWDAMLPDDRDAVTRVFVNVGKVIAAFERQILPGPSRFDAYFAALLEGDRAAMDASLTPDEVAGLRLFIGKAECTACHGGVLFTNNDFHNVGVPSVSGLPADTGRADGARQVVDGEFNCLSAYSDAEPADCSELRFLKIDGHELDGAFKTPTLRNVSGRAPYMHAGQFDTLLAVLQHYNEAPPAAIGHSELEPLGLSDREVAQLEAFLRALDGPVTIPPDPK